MLRSAFRFGIVGLANTAVGLAVIALLLTLGAGDWIANAVSYAVGLCLSFMLNRHWTFGMRGSIASREVVSFLAVFAASYAANVMVLAAMRKFGFTESLLGQAAAMVAYSVTFFLLSRRFVFAGSPAAR